MLKFLLLVVTAAVMLHVGASQPLDVNDVVMGDETIVATTQSSTDDGSTAIQDETSEEPIEIFPMKLIQTSKLDLSKK